MLNLSKYSRIVHTTPAAELVDGSASTEPTELEQLLGELRGYVYDEEEDTEVTRPFIPVWR